MRRFQTSKQKKRERFAPLPAKKNDIRENYARKVLIIKALRALFFGVVKFVVKTFQPLGNNAFVFNSTQAYIIRV